MERCSVWGCSLRRRVGASPGPAGRCARAAGGDASRLRGDRAHRGHSGQSCAAADRLLCSGEQRGLLRPGTWQGEMGQTPLHAPTCGIPPTFVPSAQACAAGPGSAGTQGSAHPAASPTSRPIRLPLIELYFIFNNVMASRRIPFFFFFGLGRIIIGSLMCLVSDSSIHKDAKRFLNKPQAPAGRGVALQVFLNSPKKSVPAICLQRIVQESKENSFIQAPGL